MSTASLARHQNSLRRSSHVDQQKTLVRRSPLPNDPPRRRRSAASEERPSSAPAQAPSTNRRRIVERGRLAASEVAREKARRQEQEQYERERALKLDEHRISVRIANARAAAAAERRQLRQQEALIQKKEALVSKREEESREVQRRRTRPSDNGLDLPPMPPRRREERREFATSDPSGSDHMPPPRTMEDTENYDDDFEPEDCLPRPPPPSLTAVSRVTRRPKEKPKKRMAAARQENRSAKLLPRADEDEHVARRASGREYMEKMRRQQAERRAAARRAQAEADIRRRRELEKLDEHARQAISRSTNRRRPSPRKKSKRAITETATIDSSASTMEDQPAAAATASALGMLDEREREQSSVASSPAPTRYFEDGEEPPIGHFDASTEYFEDAADDPFQHEEPPHDYRETEEAEAAGIVEEAKKKLETLVDSEEKHWQANLRESQESTVSESKGQHREEDFEQAPAMAETKPAVSIRINAVEVKVDAETKKKDASDDTLDLLLSDTMRAKPVETESQRSAARRQRIRRLAETLSKLDEKVWRMSERADLLGESRQAEDVCAPVDGHRSEEDLSSLHEDTSYEEDDDYGSYRSEEGPSQKFASPGACAPGEFIDDEKYNDVLGTISARVESSRTDLGMRSEDDEADVAEVGETMKILEEGLEGSAHLDDESIHSQRTDVAAPQLAGHSRKGTEELEERHALSARETFDLPDALEDAEAMVVLGDSEETSVIVDEVGTDVKQHVEEVDDFSHTFKPRTMQQLLETLHSPPQRREEEQQTDAEFYFNVSQREQPSDELSLIDALARNLAKGEDDFNEASQCDTYRFGDDDLPVAEAKALADEATASSTTVAQDLKMSPPSEGVISLTTTTIATQYYDFGDTDTSEDEMDEPRHSMPSIDAIGRLSRTAPEVRGTRMTSPSSLHRQLAAEIDLHEVLVESRVEVAELEGRIEMERLKRDAEAAFAARDSELAAQAVELELAAEQAATEVALRELAGPQSQEEESRKVGFLPEVAPQQDHEKTDAFVDETSSFSTGSQKRSENDMEQTSVPTEDVASDVTSASLVSTAPGSSKCDEVYGMDSFEGEGGSMTSKSVGGSQRSIVEEQILGSGTGSIQCDALDDVDEEEGTSHRRSEDDYDESTFEVADESMTPLRTGRHQEGALAMAAKTALSRLGGEVASTEGVRERLRDDLGKAPQRLPAILVGERVEAQFGRGDEWYKGRVTRVRGNGAAVDVEYEDGDTEMSLPSRFVRLLSEGESESRQVSKVSKSASSSDTRKDSLQQTPSDQIDPRPTSNVPSPIEEIMPSSEYPSSPTKIESVPQGEVEEELTFSQNDRDGGDTSIPEEGDDYSSAGYDVDPNEISSSVRTSRINEGNDVAGSSPYELVSVQSKGSYEDDHFEDDEISTATNELNLLEASAESHRARVEQLRVTIRERGNVVSRLETVAEARDRRDELKALEAKLQGELEGTEKKIVALKIRLGKLPSLQGYDHFENAIKPSLVDWLAIPEDENPIDDHSFGSDVSQDFDDEPPMPLEKAVVANDMDTRPERLLSPVGDLDDDSFASASKDDLNVEFVDESAAGPLLERLERRRDEARLNVASALRRLFYRRRLKTTMESTPATAPTLANPATQIEGEHAISTEIPPHDYWEAALESDSVAIAHAEMIEEQQHNAPHEYWEAAMAPDASAVNAGETRSQASSGTAHDYWEAAMIPVVPREPVQRPTVELPPNPECDQESATQVSKDATIQAATSEQSSSASCEHWEAAMVPDIPPSTAVDDLRLSADAIMAREAPDETADEAAQPRSSTAEDEEALLQIRTPAQPGVEHWELVEPPDSPPASEEDWDASQSSERARLEDCDVIEAAQAVIDHSLASYDVVEAADATARAQLASYDAFEDASDVDSEEEPRSPPPPPSAKEDSETAPADDGVLPEGDIVARSDELAIRDDLQKLSQGIDAPSSELATTSSSLPPLLAAADSSAAKSESPQQPATAQRRVSFADQDTNTALLSSYDVVEEADMMVDESDEIMTGLPEILANAGSRNHVPESQFKADSYDVVESAERMDIEDDEYLGTTAESSGTVEDPERRVDSEEFIADSYDVIEVAETTDFEDDDFIDTLAESSDDIDGLGALGHSAHREFEPDNYDVVEDADLVDTLPRQTIAYSDDDDELADVADELLRVDEEQQHTLGKSVVEEKQHLVTVESKQVEAITQRVLSKLLDDSVISVARVSKRKEGLPADVSELPSLSKQDDRMDESEEDLPEERTPVSTSPVDWFPAVDAYASWLIRGENATRFLAEIEKGDDQTLLDLFIDFEQQLIESHVEVLNVNPEACTSEQACIHRHAIFDAIAADVKARLADGIGSDILIFQAPASRRDLSPVDVLVDAVRTRVARHRLSKVAPLKVSCRKRVSANCAPQIDRPRPTALREAQQQIILEISDKYVLRNFDRNLTPSPVFAQDTFFPTSRVCRRRAQGCFLRFPRFNVNIFGTAQGQCHVVLIRSFYLVLVCGESVS